MRGIHRHRLASFVAKTVYRNNKTRYRCFRFDVPNANATVTLCHTGTRDLTVHTRRAEILVVAAGRPGTITADMVMPGVTVVDVAVNRLPDGKLVGDVDFDQVSKVAGAITPVPGGVGPMTIAMLLSNTVTAAERAADQVAAVS